MTDSVYNLGKEIPITVQTPYITGINYLDKQGSVSELNFDIELNRLHDMEKNITDLNCLIKSLTTKVSAQAIAIGCLSAIITCVLCFSLVLKYFIK